MKSVLLLSALMSLGFSYGCSSDRMTEDYGARDDQQRMEDRMNQDEMIDDEVIRE